MGMDRRDAGGKFFAKDSDINPPFSLLLTLINKVDHEEMSGSLATKNFVIWRDSDSNGGREATTILKTGAFNRRATPVDDRGNPV
jgi:hypothetical protein